MSRDEIALLEATVKIQGRIAAAVWPGFDSFPPPAVLFFTDHGQVLFNAQTAPPYYKRYSGTSLYWARSNWWTTEKRDAFGKLFADENFNRTAINSAYSSAQTNGHFSYSVFLIDSLSRYHQKGIDWSAEDWMTIFWHEVFHTYQDTRYSPELVTDDRTDQGPIKDLISSATYRSALEEEQKLMRRALLASSLEEKRDWACAQFLPKRRHRYAQLHAQGRRLAVRSEQFYEFSEGTARYVEELMTCAAAGLQDNEFQALDHGLSVGKGYGRFGRFRGRTREYYYGRIDELSDYGYYYATGFSLALLLDQVDPGWKKDVFQTEGFLHAKLENYCAGSK